MAQTEWKLDRWFTEAYEESVTKEISYTVGRDPIEMQIFTMKSEMQTEIQKSKLKSKNPLWNPETQSKNDSGSY